MHRGFCLVSVAAVLLCGCVKKTPPETQTAQAQPSAPPAESNAPVPPALSEHPLVATTRAFLSAVSTGHYDRALSLCVPEEITQQSLTGMYQTFQWDRATLAQVWVGTEQAVVITDPVPDKQGSVSAAWAFNLVATPDGHWLVRLAEWLPTPQDLDACLAAFREVAPGAKSIEP